MPSQDNEMDNDQRANTYYGIIQRIQALIAVRLAYVEGEDGISCPEEITRLIQEQFSKAHELSQFRTIDNVRITTESLVFWEDISRRLGCRHEDKEAEARCPFTLLHVMADQRYEDLKAMGVENLV
ncbi:MAG: hypothetical protein Q9186_006832 [Xanthomendoza sp. 1 TL-2023]